MSAKLPQARTRPHPGRTLAALRTRHPADQTMVVVADGTLPIQVVLEVIAAVRATPDGKPRYPDIVLARAVESPRYVASSMLRSISWSR